MKRRITQPRGSKRRGRQDAAGTDQVQTPPEDPEIMGFSPDEKPVLPDLDHPGGRGAILDPARVRTQILNGRSVLSLDALRESGLNVAGIPTEPIVDWAALSSALSLGKIERAVFRAYFERGIPVLRLAPELGLTQSAARAALASVREKLRLPTARSAVFRVDSMQRAFQEMLPSGRRCWALPRLPEGLEKDSLRKKYLVCSDWDTKNAQHDMPVATANSRSLFVMTIEQLHLKRGGEAAKLSRLSERAHLANISCEDAERALQVTEDGFRAEQAQAMLDEQEWPSRATEKILQSAQAKLSAARLSLQAIRDAVRKQSEILTEIDGEVELRRMEAFEQALKPIRERVERAITELVLVSLAANEIGTTHRMDANVLGHRLILPADPADTFADYSLRLMKCSLINGAIGLEAWSLLRSRHYAA